MGHGRNSTTQQGGLPAFFSLLFESAIKELPFQVELGAMSLSPQRFLEIQEWFFHGCVSVVFAVWLVSKYWRVPRDLHMSSFEAAINHVWRWKCNKHNRQCTQWLCTLTCTEPMTHTLRLTHLHNKMCAWVHVLLVFFFSLSLIPQITVLKYTQQARCERKRAAVKFSDCKTHRHL